MNIPNKAINKITRIVQVFETGVEKGDYSSISKYYDGPNRGLQITYGASQTTEFGNLPILIKMYAEADSIYKVKFQKWAPRVGKHPTLAGNEEFETLLKNAGNIPNLQQVQNQFFKEVYLMPAIKFCDANGLTLPFSLLVIYDSFIHSGQVRKDIRARFKELPPNKGGEEKAWITAYVNSRDSWLEYHSIKLLRNTDYRTDSFINAIRQDNWNLDKDFTVLNFKADNKTVKDRRAIIK